MHRTSTCKKDSGLSWMICFGSCLVYFLETGVLKSLGVLLPALRSEFSTQTWEIGLLLSLVPGYGCIACLLAGASRKRFSSRVVMIACGLLSSVGLIMVSCSRSILTLAISFLLTGFSFGAEAMAIAVLPDYFNKYYDAANGIAHVGLSTGIMVMPLLAQFLYHAYGWRGTLLIIGGLNFHIVVCGALIKPLHLNDIDNNNTIRTDGRQHTNFRFADLVHILDLPIFKNMKFIALLCINLGKGYFYTGWLIYLVPHSLNTGFQPYQASAIATIGGVGHLVGSFSFLLAVEKMSKQKILYSSIAVAGVSLAIDPVLTTSRAYVGLMLASFGINLGYALSSCAVYSTLADFVRQDEFLNAVNWLFAAFSLGSVSTGYFTGWLFDVYGNYTMSYLVLSAVAVISLIPLTVVNIKDCIVQRVMNQQPVSSDDPDEEV